jgi:hypothetical protein
MLKQICPFEYLERKDSKLLVFSSFSGFKLMKGNLNKVIEQRTVAGSGKKIQ